MMNNLDTKPQHPASYVKGIIKRKKLTTVKAAELLGIGRVALTNFLNEKAELSTEMAARLEKVFVIDKTYLLEMQIERYRYEVNQAKKQLSLDSYKVPIQYSDPYPLKIIAKKIENWSDYIETRSLLPVLMRRLINTTGKELTKVNFSGYENSQLPGWDGEVIAGSATQRIPLGESKWELKTSKNSKANADKDYIKRTNELPFEKRQNITFVFVTSRQWSDKKSWAENKQSKKEWHDVRAYDADDLEQWLELSPETHIWFLEKTNDYDSGLCSLEQCWEDWESATSPNLNKTLFKEAVETHKKDFLSWLQSNPPAKPFIITSDSHEEALAFLSCMFDHLDKIYGDKTIAVKSLEALRKLKTTSFRGIVIISSSEAEKNLGNYRNSVHTIIIRHKNELINKEEARITLDMPDRNSFKNSLIEMGMNYDQSERYIKDSCYSPTILRRLLSATEEGKYPRWSKDRDIVHGLVPITLIGSWDNSVLADREVIEKLFDAEWDQTIERSIAEFLNKDTTLLWQMDNKVGTKSKIENLSLINTYITESHLNKFFSIAQEVLGEEDPALELPEEDRFMAAYYDKTRKHSKYLREGICETLVLLSLHGNKWFQLRLNINIQNEVNKVIRNLLQPCKQDTWLSHQKYLSVYAEAAPKEFLKIVKEDLYSTSSTILSLNDIGTGGIFDSHPRINILWALEILAWDSQYLLKVVLILAKLSQHKINDNYANKPISSLKNIFKFWLPQTSANLEERKKILSLLIKDFPLVGLKICMDQIHVGQDICSPSCRPRWRSNTSGSDNKVSLQEQHEFIREAVNEILKWEDHDENSLGELLERLEAFNNEDKARIWKLIINWNLTNPSDEQKSKLREYIRYYVLSKQEGEANNIYDLLKPKDLVWEHNWLFVSNYVQPSISEINENYSNKQRDKQIEQSRLEALSEIWEKRNNLGLIQLISKSNACRYIGFNLRNIITQNEVQPLFDELLSSSLEEIEEKIDQFTIGFLCQNIENTEAEMIGDLIYRYVESGEENKVIRILKNAPLNNNTWKIVSTLNEGLQRRYWSETNVTNYNFNKTELNELIERLIWVNRPEFAISIIDSPQIYENISSEQLVILLKKMITNNYELWQQYQIRPYIIEGIFKELSRRDDISESDMAGLEFSYIRVLEHTDYGIPYLEKMITESPQLFIQALALVYKREDGKDDSKKWRGKNSQNNEALASLVRTLLKKVALLPGTVNGAINKDSLLNWVKETRRLSIENNREKIGDQYIGDLLSKAPIGADGVWPCEPVREVLEHVKSEQIAIGLSIGLYNSRGCVMRGRGGEQERELAVKYKEYAQFLEYDHPYVSEILNDIAEGWEGKAKYYDNNEILGKYVACK